MPYWRLFYHITWATKNRRPLIDPTWESSLHAAIVAKAKALGAYVYAIGGIEDHIHLVVSIPTSVLISKFIGQVKGNSSHFVNHEIVLDYHFSWQNEYGIVSFGQKQLDRVVKYTKNQRQHHQNSTIMPFLEKNEG
ncbi:MAG: IS200/IS605 family transposase [Chloroflexi bacterium]|jgi:putative transposase|nr:IS200/IS605 family transposase [Chloroflexota bacterium]